MKTFPSRFVLLATLGLSTLRAGQPSRPEETKTSPVSEWWNGKYATGSWFGLRDDLEDRGIKFTADWKGAFLAIVSGGTRQTAGFDEEIKFRMNVDLAQLTGWDAIEGLSLYGEVRYRDGDGINRYSGTIGNFGPSTLQGGKQWRLINAYATYTTPELFGVKEFFTISVGWQAVSDAFIKQPESKFFANNTFISSRGIGANSIGWGSSYTTWGGYVKIKPSDLFYGQFGLYLAMPYATDTRNHGLAMAGYRQNLNLNGLYSVNEIGLTPKLGRDKLPGRYAMGFLYWGVENETYDGGTRDGKIQLYWQADQMLYREASEEAPLMGKDGSKSAAKLSSQGLYFFSLFNYAPSENNLLPFYFHTGLLYQGLIPGRDTDQTGIAIAYGNYSFENIEQQQLNGNVNQQNYTVVIEAGHRFQVNKWSYVQPLIQYIIHPNGSAATQNDTIIGMNIGVSF